MLIPFESWHIDALKTSSEVKAEYLTYLAPITELAKSGFAGTVVSSSDPALILGVVGAIPISETVCEVALLVSEDRKTNTLEFVKTVKELLEFTLTKFERVQAIGEDNAFFTRWFTWLGFTNEGPITDRPHRRGMIMWSLTRKAEKERESCLQD